MELFRSYAYEVIPQRKIPSATAPRGGAVSVTPEFETELADYLNESKLATRASTIDFLLDAAGQNVVRNLVMEYLYSKNSATVKSAALSLSKRLSAATDGRTDFRLLMIIGYKDPANSDFRRLVMWAFPKDKPFQFKPGKTKTTISLPENIFSRSSDIKKGVLFEGFNDINSFFSGPVIDNQGKDRFGSAADYWIRDFLAAQPSLTGPAGTRMIAGLLKTTFDNVPSQKLKNEIATAIVALNASRRPRWSLQKFADDFLSKETQDVYFKHAPPDVRYTDFKFEKDEFAKKLNFRVFRLQDDVRIYAPFGTVGQSVKFRGKNNDIVSAEGKYIEETVKANANG